MATSLLILDGRLAPASEESCEVLDLQAFVQQAYGGHWWRRLGSFSSVRLLTQSPECLPRRWFLRLLLRLLSSGRCEIEGADGRVQKVTALSVARGTVDLLRDALARGGLHRSAVDQVAVLERAHQQRPPHARLRAEGAPYYLKTDLWLAVPAGGSVAHMAGVANNLGRFGPAPRVFSVASNPLLDPGIPFELLQPPTRFWDFRELPPLAFNADVIRRLLDAGTAVAPSWIYQRYSLHNFAGVWAAGHFNVPLVLEYNGSEVWIGGHWGSGLRHGPLAERIERLNLDAADLIVVVSQASRDELIARGVGADKILVNPNGVDADRYTPGIDATALRQRMGFQDAQVVGFIGTFGRWHGAEVLVEAFARIRGTEGTAPLRLLLIGDGQTRQACEQLARERGVADRVVFTGLVPQAEGPQWLAACDVLVAPHVPNPDGSAFFGSPTKLFEYMAMGRPIVASRLGQIGELLVHGETAWLVEPGDPQALADGLLATLRNPALARKMAQRARSQAVEQHTWLAHSRRIVEALRSRCA